MQSFALGQAPAFAGVPRRQREAFESAVAIEAVDNKKPVAPAGPETIRVLVKGQVALAVMPHEYVPGDAPIIPQAQRVNIAMISPRLLPGDVVPPDVYADRPPYLEMLADGAVELARVEAGAFAQGFWAVARRGLVSRLQIIAALQLGPMRVLGQLERALMASAMRWEAVAPGQALTRAGERATALFTPGFDTVCSAALVGRHERFDLMSQGPGALLGLAAIDPERPRVHRLSVDVVAGGRVARLDPRRFRALACKHGRLARFARAKNDTEARLPALSRALQSSAVLGGPS